jgi:hypothetical protein
MMLSLVRITVLRADVLHLTGDPCHFHSVPDGDWISLPVSPDR